MNKIAPVICLCCLIPALAPAQEDTVASAPQSGDVYAHPDSVFKFAAHLQAANDPARACLEYERVLNLGTSLVNRDTLRERAARCRLQLKQYDSAASIFGALSDGAANDSAAGRFGAERFNALVNAGRIEGAVAAARALRNRTGSPLSAALEAYGCLRLGDTAGAGAALDSCSRKTHKDSAIADLARSWIRRGEALGYKHAPVAACLGALLPGAGKVYAGQTRDGLVALGAVSFFSLQGYDGFRHNGVRSIKGWLFSALAVQFYLGNIYGSVLEIRSYNRRLEQDFFDEITFSLNVQILGR